MYTNYEHQTRRAVVGWLMAHGHQTDIETVDKIAVLVIHSMAVILEDYSEEIELLLEATEPAQEKGTLTLES